MPSIWPALAATLALLALAPLHAEATSTKKARGYRCEMREGADKVVVKSEIKSRKDCKKAGGRWARAAATPGAASSDAAGQTPPATEEPGQ